MVIKRFTETCKWSKTWFQELSPTNKCLWQYVCDHCDHAGVWEINWKLASFQIGDDVGSSNLEAFGPRIHHLSDDKILVVSFIDFQNGVLSNACPAHKPIFKALQKHGISYPINTLTLGYEQPPDRVSDTLQGKVIVQGKVQGTQEKGMQGGKPVNREKMLPDTKEQALAMMSTEAIPTDFVLEHFGYLIGTDWVDRYHNKVTDFRGHCRSAFQTTKRYVETYGKNGHSKPIVSKPEEPIDPGMYFDPKKCMKKL